MYFYVYIVCSRRNGTLYTGHTDDIVRRTWQHREHVLPGFASKHHCTRLVWYELHDTRETAFTRERQIKEWKRAWKLALIESANPHWNDLYEELINWVPVPAFSSAHPGESREPGPPEPSSCPGPRLSPG
tara:strand:+ start:483 stop:872 length:390 start_codon:yes stop_codon:yes gene_type:complete